MSKDLFKIETIKGKIFIEVLHDTYYMIGSKYPSFDTMEQANEFMTLAEKQIKFLNLLERHESENIGGGYDYNDGEIGIHEDNYAHLINDLMEMCK